MNRAPSSHVLCSRVRTLSVSILSRERAPALRRHHRNASREANITRARLHLALLEQPIAVLSSVTAEMVLAPPITRPRTGHFACRSLRRLPMLAHAAIRAALRPHADRPGLPPPALLVSCICQPCFMLDRPWAPSLQRFLPARRRPSRLPRDRSRRCAPASPPCRFPPCGAAAPRNSAFVRMRAPTSALFTRSKGRSSLGCSSPSRMTFQSRPRHFCQGSSHGLQSSVRAIHPLAVPARPTPTCALQSVRDPEARSV